MPWNIPTEITLHLGNEGYDFFEKDKDNILVDIILGILLENIFREPILQRIRIKDMLRIFKDMNKDKEIWEIYLGFAIFRLYLIILQGSSFRTIHQYFILVRPIVFCLHLLRLCLNLFHLFQPFFFYLTLTFLWH